MEFKKWLIESQSLMMPSTGRGGGTYDAHDDGEDDGGDEWDWDRMSLYRQHLLNWFKETSSMKEIASLLCDFVERQNPKKVEYRVLNSQYKREGHPRYFLQLTYVFDFDISPVEKKLRNILEKSDLHRALNRAPNSNWTLLQEEEVREYMTYIICTYLSTNWDQDKDQWQKAAEGSALSKRLSFNVWNRLKKSWDSKVLPEISEIAIGQVSRRKMERPKNWLDIGKPEVKSDMSQMRPPWGSIGYDPEGRTLHGRVVAVIPFDWNYIK